MELKNFFSDLTFITENGLESLFSRFSEQQIEEMQRKKERKRREIRAMKSRSLAFLPDMPDFVDRHNELYETSHVNSLREKKDSSQIQLNRMSFTGPLGQKHQFTFSRHGPKIVGHSKYINSYASGVKYCSCWRVVSVIFQFLSAVSK